MDLSIITVSWNTKDRLRECLQSVMTGTTGLTAEVFVVDNASQDGSADMVAQEFPHVHLIRNQINAGFSKANNQALAQATGDCVLLLNPDMRLFPDTLPKMVAWMRSHVDAGVAGCKLVDAQGHIVRHVRRFPTFVDQLVILLKLPHLFPGLLNNYLRTDFDYTQEAEVDSVRGSFFMISRAALQKVGTLDEIFFAWFEEVDYCKRVHQAGLKVMYTPVAQCVDYVGQAFKQMKRYQSQKLFTKSMLTYFKKWHSITAWAALTALRPIALVVAWCADRVQYQQNVNT